MASPTSEVLNYYRQLTNSIKPQSQFKVSLLNRDEFYDYSIELGKAIYDHPIISDLPIMDQPSYFYRNFWDRILLKEGSVVTINGQKIPLTCIFVSGQDNRNMGINDSYFPQLIIRVYLVANDFSCTGPINPGFPGKGDKEEAWDTYLYFEINDPTTMLPVEAKIRYKWNEFRSVFVE